MRMVMCIANAALQLIPAVAAVGQSSPVKLSGRVYTNYRYQLSTDGVPPGGGHPNNFEISRAYLTMSGSLGNGFSGRVTTDVDGRKASANQLTMRLKYAFLDWKPGAGPLHFELGQIPTPMIGFVESIWGYRMQGPVAMDRTGYLISSDFGVSTESAWGNNQVNAVAGIYEGEGYSSTPGDQHKDIAARVSVRVAPTGVNSSTGGVRVTGFAHYGRANRGGIRSRYMGLLSYHGPCFRLGASLAETRDSTAAISPRTKGRVISVYGTFDLPDSPMTLIGRVDRWNPDLDQTSGDPMLEAGWRTRYIFGIARKLSDQVTVMLDADLLQAVGDQVAQQNILFFHAAFDF